MVPLSPGIKRHTLDPGTHMASLALGGHTHKDLEDWRLHSTNQEVEIQGPAQSCLASGPHFSHLLNGHIPNTHFPV